MLEIKKAFMSPLTGENWKSSLGFLLVMNFIIAILSFSYQTHNTGLILITLPFSLFFGTIVSGIYYNFMHNEINNNTNLLPDWKNNIIKLFKNGFVGSFGISLYYLLPAFVLGFIAGILLIISHNSVPLKLLLIIDVIASILIMFLMDIVFKGLYSENLKFGDLSYAKMYNYVKNNYTLLLKVIGIITAVAIAAIVILSLILIVVSLIFGAIAVVLHLDLYIIKVMSTLLGSIIQLLPTIWFALFSYSLMAQAYKIMKAKEQQQATI